MSQFTISAETQDGTIEVPFPEALQPENLENLGDTHFEHGSAEAAFFGNTYSPAIRGLIAQKALELSEPLLVELDADIQAAKDEVKRQELRKWKVERARGSIVSAVNTDYYPGWPGDFDENAKTHTYE